MQKNGTWKDDRSRTKVTILREKEVLKHIETINRFPNFRNIKFSAT
jgi:hypothetical protein